MQVEQETWLPASPDELWPWLVEPARLRQWMEGFVDNRYPEEFDPAAPTGTRFQQVIAEGGGEVAYEVVIVVWNPPHEYEQVAVGQHFDCTMRYTLTAENNGTRLRQVAVFELRSVIARIMAIVGQGAARKLLARAHGRLQEKLTESSASS